MRNNLNIVSIHKDESRMKNVERWDKKIFERKSISKESYLLLCTFQSVFICYSAVNMLENGFTDD